MEDKRRGLESTGVLSHRQGPDPENRPAVIGPEPYIVRRASGAPASPKIKYEGRRISPFLPYSFLFPILYSFVP